MKPKKINKFEHENQWESWLSNPLVKHSKKPFKCGNKIATPIDISINPMTDKKSFVFIHEGETYHVDCHQCKPYILC